MVQTNMANKTTNMSLREKAEQAAIQRLSGGKPWPAFRPGDTLQVQLRVREGSRERLQMFEGVCIARKGKGMGANFTVRKISYGEGVERVFPLYSPMVRSIKVKRRGQVRRAKLYYLRPLRGKAARIAEQTRRRAVEAELPADAPEAGEKPDASDESAAQSPTAGAPTAGAPTAGAAGAGGDVAMEKA